MQLTHNKDTDNSWAFKSTVQHRVRHRLGLGPRYRPVIPKILALTSRVGSPSMYYRERLQVKLRELQKYFLGTVPGMS
jgi:hypothetical protein